MSSFKKLNKQDAFVVPYEAHKHFEISSSDFQSLGIDRFLATSGSYNNSNLIFNPGTDSKTGYRSTQYDRLVYNSLDQLYGVYHPEGLRDLNLALADFYRIESEKYVITGYVSASYIIEYFDENYWLGGQASVLSIPKNLYGNNIKPGTFSIVNNSASYADSSSFFINDYIDLDYFVRADRSGSDPFGILSASDDGYGNMIDMTSPPISGSYKKIGDILYSMGLVIFTDSSSYAALLRNTPTVMKFDSTVDIYTQVYNCKIRSGELLNTYNPSYINSSGSIYDNVTGSDFQPYVTSVGLYNDFNELIAVGKMSQPVPKSQDTDMTFVVKMDI